MMQASRRSASGTRRRQATDHGDFPVLLGATVLMSAIVVTINRLVWRPLYVLAATRYALEN
jgi:NitT/TauT family transport system permease protein